MYKDYLAFNKLQWLICRKTQPTKQTSKYFIAIIPMFTLTLYLLKNNSYSIRPNVKKETLTKPQHTKKNVNMNRQ